MVSPYVSLVLIQVPHSGLILCLAFYGAAAALAAICSGLLPKVDAVFFIQSNLKETKGKGMYEGYESVPEIDALDPSSDVANEEKLLLRKRS
jgi:hypothetical protein